MRSRRRARGAALLFAMLVVALVATVSAEVLWKQWRGVEIESAERARVQSGWLLTGELDWARQLLRDDARNGGIDHLGEAWAGPLQDAQLPSFLWPGQDTGAVADGLADSSHAVVSGQITDMQSRLNVTNLAGLGRLSEPSLKAFTRLFELLGLPPDELTQLAENMRLASNLGAEGRARSLTPVAPQRTHELVSMGLPPGTLSRLEPHITLLPARTPVNLNTASAEVIYSVIDGITLDDARRLVAERQTSPLRTVADAARMLGRPEASLQDPAVFSVATQYFEVRVQLKLAHAASQATALLQRDGLDVVVLHRDRGAGQAP